MASKKKVHISDSIVLKRGKYFWEGKTILPAWAGFRARQGGYGGLARKRHSSGQVLLHVEPTDTEGEDTLSRTQVKAWDYLETNQELLKERMLKAILKEYPKWKSDWGDFVTEDEMPEVSDIADLKDLIGLSIVHILGVAKSGFAYTGFEFGCNWDHEHGLGVKMHKQRIVSIGSAECSFS